MSNSSDPGSRRIVWLDHLKCIAAMLMVLDHTLSYFGTGAWCFWIRATLTRAVEPLYAFIFGYLFIRGGMHINWKRYGQIALASLCASTIHSLHHGQVRLDMLFNFVVVIPCLPWLLRLPRPSGCALYLACTIVSAWEIEAFGVHWDYGPFLFFAQISLTASMFRNDNWASFLKLILGFGGLAIGMAVTVPIDLGISKNVLVIAIGHPLAVSLIIWLSQKSVPTVTSTFPIQRPLTFYVAHLLVLHQFS